jgi:formiminotetrahydrofolate cyclodeaminase
LKQSEAISADFAGSRPNTPFVDIESYLDSLASAAPTPGGGSAAMIVAAAGAALVAMVARITRDNPKYAVHQALADDIIAKADRLRARALAAQRADEEAYGAVIAAMGLPKGTPEERAARTAALQAALTGAAAAPLDGAEIAKLVAVLADRTVALGNANLASDVATAAEFAAAALAASAVNVRVNHKFMKDRATIEAQERELARLESETPPLVKRVRFEVSRAIAAT